MEVQMFSSSLGAMGSLLGKLRSLLVSPGDHQLAEPQKDKLGILKQNLEEMNTLLMDLLMGGAPNTMAKRWMNEVRDLTYDIEDYIDMTMRPSSNSGEENPFGVQELDTLVMQASDTLERYHRYDLGPALASNPTFNVVGGKVIREVPTTDLVGIGASRDKLINLLSNDGEKSLKVVSVLGPVGVGKTTLAKQVYRQMRGQFQCRAFVRASKTPDTRRLLWSIISQIQRHQQTPHGLPVQELIDNVREHLQQKRYFILIDGLWETTSWDIVNSAFPESTNCSRILITTDIEEVALECCDYESDVIFQMEPLSRNISRELFFNTLFASKHECSEQLKEVSEEIIEKSGGLPLAIICIASILASQPDNSELWRHVNECLSCSMRNNLTSEGMLREIVGMSYNTLSDHLKTCLLYITSMYPEGYTFLKTDLMKQWSAEGFISAVEGKDTNEVAEFYFDDLICRGLIQPNCIDFSDEVIFCTVHSTVFEVIRCKSMEENFSTVIDYSEAITKLSGKVRRLSLTFSSAKYATKPEGITLSGLRSLTFYGLVNCLPSIMEFNLLRVLIIEFWGDKEEFDISGINKLFQLRYLRITTDMTVKLPASMQELLYLETLEMHARVTTFPSDAFDLPRLLHLCLQDVINLPDGIGRMRSLRTLKYFDLSRNSNDNVWSLKEMTNLCDLHLTCSTASSEHHIKRNFTALVSSLEKLGNLKTIILSPPSFMSTNLCCTDSVSSLPISLQKLELLAPICIFSRLPVCIGQLQKLRSLRIALKELTSGDIDSIARLQELTILYLHVSQPTLERIVFHREGFPVLKCFKFRCCVMRLAFQAEAVPNLRKLKLEFNVHRGEKYGNMLVGIEHLLNLQELTGRIGVSPGAEELDRMAAESVFKDAISKHSRLTSFNIDEKIFQFAGNPVSCSGSDEKHNRPSMADGVIETNKVAVVQEMSSFNNASSTSNPALSKYQGLEMGHYGSKGTPMPGMEEGTAKDLKKVPSSLEANKSAGDEDLSGGPVLLSTGTKRKEVTRGLVDENGTVTKRVLRSDAMRLRAEPETDSLERKHSEVIVDVCKSGVPTAHAFNGEEGNGLVKVNVSNVSEESARPENNMDMSGLSATEFAQGDGLGTQGSIADSDDKRIKSDENISAVTHEDQNESRAGTVCLSVDESQGAKIVASKKRILESGLDKIAARSPIDMPCMKKTRNRSSDPDIEEPNKSSGEKGVGKNCDSGNKRVLRERQHRNQTNLSTGSSNRTNQNDIKLTQDQCDDDEIGRDTSYRRTSRGRSRDAAALVVPKQEASSDSEEDIVMKKDQQKRKNSGHQQQAGSKLKHASARSKAGRLGRPVLTRSESSSLSLQAGKGKVKVPEGKGKSDRASTMNTASPSEQINTGSLREEKQKVSDQIKAILLDAGWTIDLRPRNGRNYMDSVYIPPSGKGSYWSVTKAYNAFRESMGSVQKDSSKGESSKKSVGSPGKRQASSSSGVTLTEDVLSKLKRVVINKRTTKVEIHRLRKKAFRKGASKVKVNKITKSRRLHLGNERKKRGGCALLAHGSNKESDSSTDGFVPYEWKRTIFSWLIDLEILSVNTKLKCMDESHSKVLLEGIVTRDGINCSCCSKVLSVLVFVAHAGGDVKKPYRNIVVDGLDIDLMHCLTNAWNKQSDSERQDFFPISIEGDDPNDDTCGICGDGGNLVCCDGCPSTFHMSCLGLEALPSADWCCANCSCKFCHKHSSDDAEDIADADSSLRSCSQCNELYHQACSPEIDSITSDSDPSCNVFCQHSCRLLFEGLQNLLGVKKDLEQEFSCRVIQRIPDDVPETVVALDERVECNSKIAVALSLMDECFLPIVDQRTGINLIRNVVYSCGSNFVRLDFSGFYIFILERGDEMIATASVRIHGTKLAEMPFIGTRNMYRRQGMCRRLLDGIEMILSSLNVEKLIIPDISELVDTWTSKFGFSPLEDYQRQEVKAISMLVFPGTDLLQKPLLKKALPDKDPCPSGGIRVREAKTEAFPVKDHRGEVYKKHYPPALKDDVWTLEKIGKDGAFHKKLNASGIYTVEDFLRLLVRDQQRLRSILGSGMSNKMWESLVKHAKTCFLSGKHYVYYANDTRKVGAIFNNIYEFTGLIADDQFISAENLSDNQKVYADALVKKAYEDWMHAVEYDGKALLSFKQKKKSIITRSDTAAASISNPTSYVSASSQKQSPLLTKSGQLPRRVL